MQKLGIGTLFIYACTFAWLAAPMLACSGAPRTAVLATPGKPPVLEPRWGWLGPADASVDLELARDATSIRVRAHVSDDKLVMPEDPAVLGRDSFELYIDARPPPERGKAAYGPGALEVMVLPSLVTGKTRVVFSQGTNWGASPDLAGVAASTTRTTDGYDIELVLPVASFERSQGMGIGTEFNFDFGLFDVDGGGQDTQFMWKGAAYSHFFAGDFVPLSLAPGDRRTFTLSSAEQIVSPSMRVASLSDDALGLRSLPRPSLIPAPDALSGVNASVSLDGDWEFAPGRDAKFAQLKVPSNHAFAGYQLPRGDVARYRRTFVVPAAWKGERVVLRFDSIEGGVNLRLNGVHATSWDMPYSRFDVDVTPQVRWGESNVAELSVDPESVGARLTGREGGSLFGDVTGEVLLFAVPQNHVSQLELLPTLSNGRLETIAEIECHAAAPAAELRVEVLAPDGGIVARDAQSVPPCAPGQRRSVKSTVAVANPHTWDPEHPRLYQAKLTLEESGAVRQRFIRRFGFRELRIAGEELTLNGRPFKLFGVNYHPTHPNLGWALPTEQYRKDMALLRAAHVNMVRVGPTCEALFNAADELGITLQVELPASFVSAWRAPEKILLGRDLNAVRQFVADAVQLVELYRNHPSVVIWSTGNESDWVPIFEAAARAFHRIDPTRPVLMSQDGGRGVGVPALDIDTNHYPDLGLPLRLPPQRNRPLIVTEWLHTNSYNVLEHSLDPGLREYWSVHAEHMISLLRYNHEALEGANVFTGLTVEYALPATFRREHPVVYGLLDGFRRPAPEYFHIQQLYAPLALVSERYASPNLELTFEYRFQFTDPRELAGTIRQGSHEHPFAVGAVQDGQLVLSLPLDLPPSEQSAEVRLTNAAGATVFVQSFGEDPAPSKPALRLRNVTSTESGTELRVTANAETWLFRAGQGLVDVRGSSGPPIVVGPPVVTVTPRTDTPASGGLTNWRATNVARTSAAATPDGVEVQVDGEYAEATGTFRYGFVPNSPITLSYDFTWRGPPRDAREIGLTLNLNPQFQTISWQRQARWSNYPADHIGRPTGTANAFRADHYVPTALGTLPTWPWALDETERGTNDFRSTKYHIFSAELSDRTRELTITSDGSQSVRAAVEADRGLTSLLIADHSNGGSEQFLYTFQKVKDVIRIVKPGDRLQGTARLMIHPATALPPPRH